MDYADAALLGESDREGRFGTVSIADEQSGMLRAMFRENRVRVSTSLGRISEYAGTSKTSSNVRPSLISVIFISFL